MPSANKPFTPPQRSADDVRVWERYPDAGVDHDNRAYYEAWLRRELCLNRCADCGAWHHPPRAICPKCWSFDVRATPVSGRGVVALTTLLRQGPAAEGVEYPYPVVAVDLEEQEALRITSTIVGGAGRDEVVPIGTPVELAWTERGGAPFPVFRIVDNDEERDGDEA